MPKRIKASLLAADQVPGPSRPATYKLRLYIAGVNLRSTQAIASVKAICEQYLADRYELEVVDVYQQPALASDDRIIAVPTLIKTQPFPPHRLVGVMTDPTRVLTGLDLKVRK